jgi:hypothetical protein
MSGRIPVLCPRPCRIKACYPDASLKDVITIPESIITLSTDKKYSSPTKRHPVYNNDGGVKGEQGRSSLNNSI